MPERNTVVLSVGILRNVAPFLFSSPTLGRAATARKLSARNKNDPRRFLHTGTRVETNLNNVLSLASFATFQSSLPMKEPACHRKHRS